MKRTLSGFSAAIDGCREPATMNNPSARQNEAMVCSRFIVAPREADKLTTADFNTVEWQKEIKACLSGGTWTKKERDEFISSCINSAKEGGLPETKAKNYCECSQFKVEKKYPNIADLDKITEEDLKSDFWTKLMASCLDN